MKIVIINPPHSLEERYGNLAGAGSNLPSIGVLCLAAVLRKEGFSVKAIDAAAQNLSYAQCVEEISSFGAHFVGMSAVTPSICKAARLAEQLKTKIKGIQIAVGGAHITAVPKETLERYPQFDVGVIGEGENTIVELAQAIQAGSELCKIPGLAFRESDGLRFTEPRESIKDLDSLPFPAWDLLPNFPHGYRPAAFKCKRFPATYLTTSRGCPHKCIFCDTSVFSRQYRPFGAPYIIEMIEKLYRDYGIREISFEDDTFIIFRKRLEELCETLIRKKIHISWTCNGRANAVKPEILRLMKRAGCWQIAYGIESGEQAILDFAKKQIKLPQITQAIRWTHEARIYSKGFFILGFPMETEATMQRTIDFAKSLPLDDISVCQMIPFPGSEMYEIGQKFGHVEKDWEKMNLLDVVFVPNGLSKQMLEEYQKRFLKDFYLRPRVIFSYFKRALAAPNSLTGLLSGLVAFLRTVWSSSGRG
jgi:radical SAM superfamily enzyme YgiQ (UPF0313 family)